jgi:uncharacterized DUF497 family protein
VYRCICFNAVLESSVSVAYTFKAVVVMRWTQVVWDPTPGGNVEHVEEHGLTTDDVDHVLEHPGFWELSRSSGRGCVFGHVPDGRFVVVVFEEIGDVVTPVTAYEISEP